MSRHLSNQCRSMCFSVLLSLSLVGIKRLRVVFYHYVYQSSLSEMVLVSYLPVTESRGAQDNVPILYDRSYAVLYLPDSSYLFPITPTPPYHHFFPSTYFSLSPNNSQIHFFPFPSRLLPPYHHLFPSTSFLYLPYTLHTTRRFRFSPR